MAIFGVMLSDVGKVATGFANPNGIESFSPGLRALVITHIFWALVLAFLICKLTMGLAN